MADGSEVASAVIVIAAPGHVMPDGADPSTEEGVRAWAEIIHPKFAALDVAGLLIAQGYDTMLSMRHLDVETLCDDYSLKEGHAKLFHAAAQAVCRSLGYVVSSGITTTGGHGVRRVRG